MRLHMKMQWENDPHKNNPDAATIHTNVRLPVVYEAMLTQIDGWSLSDRKPLVGGDRNLITALVSIDGVTEVSISKSDPYKAYIKKARVFDWSDIKPQVERILCAHYPEAVKSAS